MTTCIKRHVEAQYREEIEEFGIAAEQIKAWTLQEFQVDPQYILDIEYYAKVKNKKIENTNEKIANPFA
jgi:hypothetical protein